MRHLVLCALFLSPAAGRAASLPQFVEGTRSSPVGGYVGRDGGYVPPPAIQANESEPPRARHRRHFEPPPARRRPGIRALTPPR